jgi:ABC-type uncharacterized transport system ATPase subunit
VALDGLPEHALAHFRRRRVEFVFQFFNLLPTLTVVENVALPLLLGGVDERPAQERANQVLERVRVTHFPAALSGGEMQRAAVARAIVGQPALVLANEPTGSLDSANGAQVSNYFTNYDSISDWQIVPGWLDGREILAVLRDPRDARPGYFVELTLVDDCVAAIRDFRYAPYIAREATFEFSS